MPDPALPIPIEVPWQLLSTTLPFEGPLLPNRCSLSVFSYVPNSPTLASDFPNDQLVFLKFSLSIAPELPNRLWTLAELFMTQFAPVWHAVLDVQITSNPPKPTSARPIRPFFLDAAPLRRWMRETGVLGEQVYEGESGELSVGKSASQLHESFRTGTTAGTDSTSLGPFTSGNSASSTTGERDVVQTVDTTTRDASVERRELLSHTTQVENLLSLLNGLYVGTPYLRFSLWPQPLHALTRDPTDRELWYAELLRRRSSGIEGVQDFYAIAAVPRGDPEFCIDATLRRFVVNEPPLPNPNDVEAPDLLNDAEQARLLDYLHRRYPRGTPLDELDVDVSTGQKETQRKYSFSDTWTATTTASYIADYRLLLRRNDVEIEINQLRPAVSGWQFGEMDPHLDVFIDYAKGTNEDFSAADLPWFQSRDLQVVAVWYKLAERFQDKRGDVPDSVRDIDAISLPLADRRAVYKTVFEVWQEMQLANYHAELLKSPLERGKLEMKTTELHTCVKFAANGNIVVAPTSSTASSSSGIAYLPPPNLARVQTSRLEQVDFRRAVAAWNLAQEHLTMQAESAALQAQPVRLSDDDVVGHFLGAVVARGRAAPNNTPLANTPWLSLPGALSERLAQLKIEDLFGLAQAVVYAPEVQVMRARNAALLPTAPTAPPTQSTGQKAAPIPPYVTLTARLDRALLWLRARAQTLKTGTVAPATSRGPANGPPPPAVAPVQPAPPLRAAELSELRRLIGAQLEAYFAESAR